MKTIAKLVGGNLLFVSSIAFGCSCAQDPALSLRDLVQRNFEASSIVGVFEVVGFKSSAELSEGRMKGRFALLSPVELWKGVGLPQQRFYALMGGRNTSCEVSFEKGELLLVYADQTEPIRINFCSFSGRLSGKLREVRYLFELTEPDSGR